MAGSYYLNRLLVSTIGEHIKGLIHAWILEFSIVLIFFKIKGAIQFQLPPEPELLLFCYALSSFRAIKQNYLNAAIKYIGSVEVIISDDQNCCSIRI